MIDFQDRSQSRLPLSGQVSDYGCTIGTSFVPFPGSKYLAKARFSSPETASALNQLAAQAGNRGGFLPSPTVKNQLLSHAALLSQRPAFGITLTAQALACRHMFDMYRVGDHNKGSPFTWGSLTGYAVCLILLCISSIDSVL